jgi:hypothetical protein
MASEKALEEQVKILQKQFGGVVKLVKDLKLTVEALGKKLDAKEIDEVKEILDAQKVIDEVIVAHSDAIKRIDREIKDLVMKKKVVEVQNEALENTTRDDTENTARKKMQIL